MLVILQRLEQVRPAQGQTTWQQARNTLEDRKRRVSPPTTPRRASPIKKPRSWAFVLCFLGIGLSTRFAELATFGLRPFWAFTIGVLVNVPLGYVLSTIVFSDYWARI